MPKPKPPGDAIPRQFYDIMKPATFNRLHELRMANDAARYEMDERRPRFDRMAGRHENGTAPRAVAAFQLFQTPAAVAARLAAAAMAGRSFPNGARVLEPSAGLGRLLDALAPYRPGEIVAVEIAPQCAGELFAQDRPGVKILQRDFLTLTPGEITGPAQPCGPVQPYGPAQPVESGVTQVDAVVMNPPFHMRADIRHILHARQFLKPGGILAAICFDTPHRSAALKPLAATWEPLPAGTFRHEGTNVPTVLLTMRGENHKP
jgi:SAM-dependent methyltransferase